MDLVGRGGEGAGVRGGVRNVRWRRRFAPSKYQPPNALSIAFEYAIRWALPSIAAPFTRRVISDSCQLSARGRQPREDRYQQPDIAAPSGVSQYATASSTAFPTLVRNCEYS